jgi:arylsulfatase A-like enzyme
MLAERVKQAGYRTAGFVGSFALARRFAMDQGFDLYDENLDLLIHPKRYDQNQRRAGRVTDAVIESLDAWRGEPLFLFVHYFDPHAPYDPPAPFDKLGIEGGPAPEQRGLEYLRRAVSEHQRRASGQDHGGLKVVFNGLNVDLLEGATGRPGEADATLAALYAGEISYVDSQVGRLLDALSERGILDRAVLVIVSDHGETLWEHGDFYNHGLALYETTVRVPLLIRLPDRRHAGTAIETPVSTVDILPTLLELLDLPAPGNLEGISLVGELEGKAGRNQRPLFSGATQPTHRRFHPEGLNWRNDLKARSVRDGRWKLVETPYLGHRELYDLETDLGERRNLLLAPTAELLATAERLGVLLAEWNRSAYPLPSYPSKEHAEEVRRRLEALGYF